MPSVDDLFDVLSAKSIPFEDHDRGTVPFVTNGYRNNGVVGHVAADESDRVFDVDGICVSAFCQATVQTAPFIARGNGGSGLTVLVPRVHLSLAELWGYAAYLSEAHRWKFSFGRMATGTRVRTLALPATAPLLANTTPSSLLPAKGPTEAHPPMLTFEERRVDQVFRVRSGHFHSVSELASGDIPLISCGDQDNGIIGFFNPPPDCVYEQALTVAYNGDWPLMAKFHPYKFCAKDDVAILTPIETMPLATLLFMQTLFNREVWRHSYGRKLYRARLEKFELQVPIDSNREIDHSGIRAWLETSPLWQSLQGQLTAGITRVRKQTLALVEESH